MAWFESGVSEGGGERENHERCYCPPFVSAWLEHSGTVGQNLRLTFREFHGPGPAEGAGEPAELHVELLHRSFHHRDAARRAKRLECGRGSPPYSPLAAACGSWSMGASKSACFLISIDLPTRIFRLPPTTSCCRAAVHSGGCSHHRQAGAEAGL